MYKQATKWDYFCELMTAIPGLAAMFVDDPKKTEDKLLEKAKEVGEKIDEGVDRAEEKVHEAYEDVKEYLRRSE